jgi:hypothetical protein
MQTCPAQQPTTPQVGLTETNGQWSMVYQGTTYGPGQYPKIGIPCNSHGNFTFTIQGNSSVGFSSYNLPASTPISVAQGTAKPNGNSVDSQITGISVSNNGKVLQFSDSNLNQGSLNYVLHFTDGSSLDPIIQNGGGCCTMMPPSTGGGIRLTSTSFVAGLVAGFLIALLLVALVRFGARRA